VTIPSLLTVLGTSLNKRHFDMNISKIVRYVLYLILLKVIAEKQIFPELSCTIAVIFILIILL